MEPKTLEEKRQILADLKTLVGADEYPVGEGRQSFLKHEFSPRQKRYLAYRLQGYSNPEAAKKAGYKTASGGRFVWQKLRSNDQIIEAFESQGITPAEIAAKVKELLNCTTLIRVSEGDAREVPDNTNRNKALQTAVEIVGGFAPKHETVTIQTFEQKVELIEQIKDNPQVIDKLKQRLIEIKKTKGTDGEP